MKYKWYLECSFKFTIKSHGRFFGTLIKSQGEILFLISTFWQSWSTYINPILSGFRNVVLLIVVGVGGRGAHRKNSYFFRLFNAPLHPKWSMGLITNRFFIFCPNTIFFQCQKIICYCYLNCHKTQLAKILMILIWEYICIPNYSYSYLNIKYLAKNIQIFKHIQIFATLCHNGGTP